MASSKLDYYKKLSIIRRSNDTLNYEDTEGNLKTVSVEELGDAIATATPLVTPRSKLDIPVPRINAVESYERDVTAEYRIPLSYVRYHRPTLEEWKSRLDYVLDREDESWLKNNSKFGGAVVVVPDSAKPPASRLPRDLFEHMMDILEKATGFNTIITTNQAETLIMAKIPMLTQIFTTKARQGVVTAKQVVVDVHNYWVQKRSKLKRPLLRRYWPVTSSDDTNPHLVFRPREKEKYKLRKKRQNDLDAFRKMQQLRSDFDNLRAVTELVRRREQLQRLQVLLQIDTFEQRMYDAIDTSGLPREKMRVSLEEVESALDVPSYFDTFGGRKVKRARKSAFDDETSGLSTAARFTAPREGADEAAGGATAGLRNVAGRNSGVPAPLFVHPLNTRESYTTSWDSAVPHVPTYSEAQPTSTFRFRHRPRLGRGGRICIDRLPRPSHPDNTPVTVFTAGKPMPHATHPQARLLDLLPRPLDPMPLSRRIEEISVAGLKEDFDARALSAAHGGEPEENDGEEIVVKMDDWLDTDDQLWGEERFAIGPI